MNNYWIIFCVTIVLSSFSAGMYTESRFNKASLATEEAKVITKEAKGQQDIIQFHQQLAKIYVKTPCDTTDIPSDELKLLH